MNIYLILHKLLLPIPSISKNVQLPTSFPIVLESALLPLSVLVGGWGDLYPWPPSRTPISAMISVILTCYARDSPANTTSITALRGVDVHFLPVKVVITLRVLTTLNSVVS